MKKYELTDETKIEDSRVLHRIKALKNFSDVKAGDLGGWIEDEDNLSQNGICWIYDDAKVCDSAKVCGHATIYNYSTIEHNAWVSGRARIYDNAVISGDAWIYDNAAISKGALIYGNAEIYGDAEILGSAEIYGAVDISGNTKIYDDAEICGNAIIDSNASIKTTSDYLTICPIGGSKDSITFFKTADNQIKVALGYFRSTIAEFESVIYKVYPYIEYAKEYQLAIELAKLRIKIKE